MHNKTTFFVAIALLALLVACESNESDKDGPLPHDAIQKDAEVEQGCDFDPECAEGQVCQDGRCVQLCNVGAGEFLCNDNGSSDFPPECCQSGQLCCPVGAETSGCYSGRCPILRGCRFTDQIFTDVCLDSYCLYTPPPDDGGQGSVDGGAGTADAMPGPACVRHWQYGCVPECAPEDLCGPSKDDCCGEGTHCDQGCCVLD